MTAHGEHQSPHSQRGAVGANRAVLARDRWQACPYQDHRNIRRNLPRATSRPSSAWGVLPSQQAHHIVALKVVLNPTARRLVHPDSGQVASPLRAPDCT